MKRLLTSIQHLQICLNWETYFKILESRASQMLQGTFKTKIYQTCQAEEEKEDSSDYKKMIILVERSGLRSSSSEDVTHVYKMTT